MNWREVTAIVWLGFALGALTDTALRYAGTARTGQYDVASGATVSDNGDGSDATRPAPPSTAPDRQSSVSREDTRDADTAIATTGVVTESPVDGLRTRSLEVPVKGVERKDLRDTFTDTRSGSRSHEAMDIMAPRRTPVRAVEDGTIQKLFTSKAGGLTIYQFEPSGTFCYYYAHLDGYVDGLHEGQMVHKGEVIGYVGSTGNAAADAPHLHFAIFRLTPERQWWKGEPINPYSVLK